MSLAELLVLSAALGTDLFSVAIPIGMNRLGIRTVLQASAVFAVFHIVMILTGYHAGHWLGSMVEHVETYHVWWPAAIAQDWASLIGAMVLAGLGIHMVRENMNGNGFGNSAEHPLKGLALMALALSVSLDALAAGFSMGMMDVELIKLSMVLGTVIFVISLTGLGLGRQVGRLAGARAELAGGIVLVMLSLHIFWTALGA